MTSVSRAAAMRGASIITGINVLVASGFSLAGLVSPQSVLPGAERGENSRDHPFRGIDALIELARCPKVAVKWGHVTEWSAKPFPYQDALDQLQRVVDAFGASRVMWESDWTQTLGNQTLAEMFFSIKLSDRLNVDEKAYLLGRTALEVMRRDRPEHEVDTVVVGADVWEEFLHKTKNSGQLPHGRVEVIKAGESTAAAGRAFGTLRLPNATTVAVDKLVEASCLDG